jgi:magnesium-transporting ATPase (P-type)
MNDAPALARADIGTTMGGETDIALVGGTCAPLLQCEQRRLARRSSCLKVLLAHVPSSLILPALVPTGER